MSELKGLLDCFGGDEDAKINIMQRCQTIIQQQEKEASQLLSIGLTLDGLKRIFIEEIEERDMNEDFMFDWLENLGYDQDLYPVRSRCFMLTMHTNVEIDLQIRDAI